MVDLHVHILPELDDGAKDWEDALDMADMASSSGVRTLVALSHANLPGQNSAEFLKKYWEQFYNLENLLKKEGSSLEIVPGMELMSDGRLPGLLKEEKFLTLNGTKYALIEFDFEVSASQIYEDVDGMLNAGYIPVLAHPERYRCVSRQIGHVFEWQQMGAVIQVNKGSILGRFSERIRRNADLILKHRIASVVASDAHSSEYRTTEMNEVAEILETYYGSASVEILLKENPWRILCGEEILDSMPISFEQTLT
ncbi:tyrosine-protein phosphatase [Lachnoclostridium sp. An181]|uniref:tyrosine-protein phosphatase n=1 Tax=Lachnoclostridium sp. An181 TaxID=1965575 RepID=UPI000B383158|nr:CpsB/CapC family capsule biosynthesis tyrosine phosphatase [Lachnoclostridium sp. An181]OUP50433.1 hypothetical protein B5F18_04445 [Lachnoclostridium sp. An181]